MNQREHLRQLRQGVKMGLNTGTHIEAEVLTERAEGEFHFKMTDARTGEVLKEWTAPNRITRDAGILVARLLKDSNSPNAGVNNGLKMLAIGTGATGNILSPDSPQDTQRKLNTEIARKAFSTTQFRNAAGIAVSIPTNIVDYTVVFGEAEAVGALDEMALISPYSADPETTNPINNGPDDYDPTIDVSALDLMANYLTFPVVSKPSTAILTITWRITA